MGRLQDGRGPAEEERRSAQGDGGGEQTLGVQDREPLERCSICKADGRPPAAQSREV